MKAVVFAGDRRVEFRDFEDPTPGPGEVVLEIKASGMCGSDLNYYRAAPGEAAKQLGLGAHAVPSSPATSRAASSSPSARASASARRGSASG